MEQLFDQNEVQTKRLVKAMKEENEAEFIGAIRAGERTLEGMGVVSKKVIPLIRKIETIGGAAKLLGGGGKKDSVGFLLCFHRDQRRVAQVCKSYNYSIQPITLGAEGIRLEQS
jgi:mevalonate kinase